MARPKKEGLDYINIDVDIFDDPKLMFVCERFGEKGEIITIKLLLEVYKNGYYLKWDDEVCLLFANRKMKNASFDLVNDTVNELLKRGFFNEDMYKRFGILTSRGIQERWMHVIQKSKRNIKIRQEHDLILAKIREETTLSREETTAKREETPSNTEESTHSIVKKSIVNNSKEKYSKDGELFLEEEDSGKNEKEESPSHSAAPPPSDAPWKTEDFSQAWKDWIKYKSTEHNFNFVSLQSRQAALAELFRLAGNNSELAVDIIRQSIAKGWKSFFPLNKDYGTSNKGSASAAVFKSGDRDYGKL